MLRFLSRRVAAGILLLFVVLVTTFVLLHAAPGDPTAVLFGDQRVSAETRQAIRAQYGLDQPLWRQFLIWLGSVLRGDLGTSIVHGRGAAQVLFSKLPATLLLVIAGFLIEYALGLGLGMAAALHPGGRLDRWVRSLSLFFYSVPYFWLAVVLIDLLAVRAGWFPINMMRADNAMELSAWERLVDLLHHLALPALSLGLAQFGLVSRFVHNGLVEVLEQDYVRTARASGLPPLRIVWVHGMKNAVGPLLQRFGAGLPARLSGALLLEVIFSWPGVGQAIYAAVLQRDYPVVLASTVFSGVAVVLTMLAVDLVHAWIDPRVRDAL